MLIYANFGTYYVNYGSLPPISIILKNRRLLLIKFMLLLLLENTLLLLIYIRY